MDYYYDNNIFANNLKAMLEKHNRTSTDLAKYLGVSKSLITDYTMGRKLPRMSKVEMMCRYFNCTRSDLIDDQTNKDIEAEILVVLEQMTDEQKQKFLNIGKVMIG